MNSSISKKIFWCFVAISISAVNHSVAQTAITVTGGGFGIEESDDVVKNLPYQALAVTEGVRTLAEGSHITEATTATVARDSEGRTVRIQELKRPSDSSDGNNVTSTSIFDPVAKTHTSYKSDSKVAHVIKLPDAPAGANVEMRSVAGPVSGVAGTFFLQGHAVVSSVSDQIKLNTESLGTKTIEGFQTTGTRNTTTIPAGTIGNDKDIVVTSESWYSPDLKVVLQSTRDDPRFGKTNYSLTNIQRSEPDESLFQIPAGYKIETPHIF